MKRSTAVDVAPAATAKTMLLVLCGLAASCTGSKSPLGVICTANIVPAIVVEIRSAQTLAPLADSASGFVIDGAYSDSLRPFRISSSGELLSRQAAGERPGLYTVLVTRPGYANWSTSGVRVTDGDCHVNTVTLQADLATAP